MTMSANSGERSTLPMGGMRRWNTRRNGRVRLFNSGITGLYGLTQDSTACTITATITM